MLQTSKFQLQPRPVMLMSTNRINILGLVLEDLRAQREGFLAAGFWVLLVYRFGHARFAIRSKWLRLPWTIVYRILFKVVEIVFGVTLPASATVGRRLCIEHFGGIVVHGGARIGDDCLLRHGVTIGNRHRDRLGEVPTLGNGVDVGAGAKILGKVTIGDGAAIGANAVVLHDVPPGCTAVGVPARVLNV